MESVGKKKRLHALRSSYYGAGGLAGLAWSLFRALLIAGISYVILFPVISKLVSSVMMERDLFDKAVMWIPKHFTLEYYRLAWRGMNYPVAFRNSFMLATLVSVLHLLSASIIGYGFARFEYPGSGLVFACVIMTIVVPPESIMYALYLNFRFFNPLGLLRSPVNLIGSYWPYVLMGITGTGFRNGLFIYIMRQFFRSMPTELEEAAYVDGAGFFRTFYQVMLPSALPGMVVVFLFSFVWQWNDSALISVLWKDVKVLPQALDSLVMILANALQDTSKSSMITKTANEIVEGTNYINLRTYMHLVRSTGMLLFIAPPLILYAFMQRYFVESVERTGIVG